MGAKLKDFWNWLTKSRYTRHLEDEIARLREREIATVDALLTQVGAPTISHRLTKPRAPVQGPMLPSQVRRMFEEQDRKNAAEAKSA